MSERPTEFVVRRSTWLRGRPTAAKLRKRDGTQCCLGFVAQQCGLRGLQDKPAPRDLARAELLDGFLTVRSPNGFWVNTELAKSAMRTNDDSGITDVRREARLTALFAEHGLALRFEP